MNRLRTGWINPEILWIARHFFAAFVLLERLYFGGKESGSEGLAEAVRVVADHC